METPENQSNLSEEDQAADSKTELELLKGRARMMGVIFSNNIGLDALKEKVNAKLGETPAEQVEDDVLEEPVPFVPNALSVGEQSVTTASNTGEVSEVAQAPVEAPKKKKTLTLRQALIAENMRLIRLRITNMDPKKKDLSGEIITVANEYIGTVRKFIPFGEFTEGGYHVPYCIYKALKRRKFLNIRTKTDRKTNNNTPQVSDAWAAEFALEVLPPLTPEEIERLAVAQISAGSIE